MSKPNYQCRRCEKLVDANPQPWTVRVVCYWCGGTCDPTPEELARLKRCRAVKTEQRIRNIRANSYLATNAAVNANNNVVGITAKDLE